MSEQDQPQIYLISPPSFDLLAFDAKLSRVLDQQNIACVRLALAADDEDHIARSADQLRETCHARDVAIVIERHFKLVDRHGLDGCHLPDGAKNLSDVRKELGADAIIGAHCGTSKHSGMSAGEAGADYVCFGPLDAGNLGTGEAAKFDLFQWWSDVIEVPVVAEGGLTQDLIAQFAPVTDFFALGSEIWSSDTPDAALRTLLEPLA